MNNRAVVWASNRRVQMAKKHSELTGADLHDPKGIDALNTSTALVMSQSAQTISISGSALPNADDTYDLGASGTQWKDLYIDGTANIDSLTLTSGATVTAVLDEDAMGSDSATSLATQKSVKAYVDSVTTELRAQDLDFQGDSGGALSIDLDSESLTIAGGTNASTTGSGNGVTVNVHDVFLRNDASDTTSGTVTAAGFTTTGTVSASLGKFTSATISGGTISGITDLAVADGGTGASTLNDLITLGTHTTGNYVATLTAGALIDLQNNSGETASPTIDVDLTEAGEAAIANGDYILFLDGGATGTHAKEAVHDLATLFSGTGLTATNSVIAVDAAQTQITSVGTIGTGTWEATDVAVAHGGTGVSTFASNGILYGNGTGAVQVTAAGTDDYFLYSNSGTPAWTNEIDGGTF